MRPRPTPLSSRLPRSALRLLSAFALAFFGLLCLHVFISSPATSISSRSGRFLSNVSIGDPGFCVIARTDSSALRAIAASILSLTASAYPRLHIFLLRTDKADIDSVAFTDFSSDLNHLLGEPMVSLLKMDGHAAMLAFPDAPAKDFGYLATDLALETLLPASVGDFCASGWNALIDIGMRTRSRHRMCGANMVQPLCDYFLISSSDNLYAETLIPSLLPHMREKRVAVAWDFISNRNWPPDSPGVCPTKGGASVHMSAAYKVARIDLGAAIVRAEHLRQRPNLRFLVDKLREKKRIDETDLSTLDGLFFEKLISEPEIHRDDLVVTSNTWMLHQ